MTNHEITIKDLINSRYKIERCASRCAVCEFNKLHAVDIVLYVLMMSDIREVVFPRCTAVKLQKYTHIRRMLENVVHR